MQCVAIQDEGRPLPSFFYYSPERGDRPLELFKIFGTIALENADAIKGMKDTTSHADDAASKIGSAFSKMGSAALAAGKLIATGLAAGATAVGALVKSSVEGYAEYEQLVGGSQLLFGEAYDFIADKAANAYSTVQMSQNDYLQQVNGFATGLKTAMDGNAQAAAELADRIITAEADIVAATGNSQEAVQNAFNGIMKSNYTMLDNLQLGITPTKEGFQEVIDKVNEWNTANGEATEYTIDNLADCQSALLDYVEMQGLSGYAAKEAAGTIQGSLSMVKASWKNLIVGMARDEADFESLISNFVTSVGYAADNILPRIEIALMGAAQLIQELVPVIMAMIPELIENFLPELANSAVLIVQSLVDGIQGNSEMLISTVLEVCGILGSAIVSMLPQIFSLGFELVVSLVSGIAANAPEIVSAAQGMIFQIVETLTNPDSIASLLQSALVIILAVASGIVDSLPKLVESAIGIVNQIVQTLTEPDTLSSLLDAALEIILAVAEGLVAFLPELAGAAAELIIGLVSFLLEPGNLSKLIEAAVELVGAMAEGLLNSVGVLAESAAGLASAVVEGILSTNWLEVGASIVAGIAEGFANAWGNFAAEHPLVADGLAQGINLGISGGMVMGSHASGLDYVPFDGYIAELHKGEMVLPANDASMLRNGTVANYEIATILTNILDAIQEGNSQDTVMKLNNREFGRLVKAVN